MCKRAVLSSCLFLLTVMLLMPSAASAQAVYGSIFGTVNDPTGAAVPKAKVTVTNVRKATSDTATTNVDGNYSVTHLIPDVYTVRVEAPGFKTTTSDQITVFADASARFDAKLAVGSATETLEVTAEAPQLKTDRADVSTVFDSKYLANLPLLNRNFTSLELASPGTQKLVGWNHAATENPQGSLQIFVNGQHFSGTAYELDGTDNQDPILGIIVVNPNVDAITETKWTLQNYDAEFGKAVAGIMTVQTKSGSNDLHGEAFWFRRTDATAARDPFTQYAKDPITGRFIPSARWNQFGGMLGGPIIKNKLFFFGDYQGTRQTVGTTVQMTVPTQHVLDTCLAATGNCDLSQYVPFIGNGKAGDPTTTIYNPATTTIAPSGNAIRTPFACGPDCIPVSQLSPQAINILKLFPKPTNSAVTNNFIGSGSAPFSQNQFDTRIDFDASQTLQVFGRFSLAYFKLSGTPSLGAVGGVGFGLGGLAGSSINHDYSLATGFTKTLSNTLLTDFRFGWFRYNPVTHKVFEGKQAAKDLGLPGMNMGDLFTSGLPMFEGAGPISNFGEGLDVTRCNCPLIEDENQFQWVNNWTKIKGNHQIKWGADIRYAMNLRVPSDANRTGQLFFNTGPTSNNGTGGMGFASFLLGQVNNFNRFVSTSLNAAERQKRWFFYAQDTYRMTPKLTLNYGLRWEIYFPESVNGKGNGGFANPVEGIIRVGGFGKYGLNGNINNSWKAFAPRLGIAYQLTSKTVVRLGYGRSFDIGVFGSNFGHAVTQNLPVLVNQQVQPSTNTANNGLVPPAGATLNNGQFAAFTLAQGPPAFTFPAVPSNGVLPLGGPQNNVQPRMRPTFQRLPTLDAWNATVQHQLTNTMSLEVAYVANKATHVFAGNGPAYDLNQVPFGPGSAIVTAAGTAPGFTATTPPDQRRPFYNKFAYPGFIDPSTGKTAVCCNNGSIMGNYFGNDASANYQSMHVRLEKRFSRGLQFMSTYTFSHANNFSADNGFIYSVAPRLAYGPTDMNRNHVWISNVVWELPFGKGKMFAADAGRALDLIIGGWQITSTLNWSSGLPWTTNAGECSLINDTGPCLPNIKGSFKVGAGSFDPVAHKVVYFTPVAALTYPASALTVGTNTCSLSRPTSGAFSLPACGTTGNVGRNSFNGPRYFGSDMSLMKNFHATERVALQFRMDAFNVFNHPVYGFSSQDYGATGGTCIDCGGDNGKIKDIENGTTMRQLQFALKLIF